MSKPTCRFHSPEDPTSLLRKNSFKPKQNYWQKLDFPTDELEFGSGTYIRKFGIDNVLRQKSATYVPADNHLPQIRQNKAQIRQNKAQGVSPDQCDPAIPPDFPPRITPVVFPVSTSM